MFILCLVFISYILRKSIFIVKVNGDSMQPTFKSGQRLIFFKPIFFDYHYSDVILIDVKKWQANISSTSHIKYPYVIKRIIAKQGDKVLDTTNNHLEYVRLFIVPFRHYYVLGDNHHHSLDSRQLGSVPRNSIVGKFVKVLNSNSKVTL